jgi:hypothetical protein
MPDAGPLNIDLHLSTADRHAVGIHPRVNIGSAPTAIVVNAFTVHQFQHQVGLAFFADAGIEQMSDVGMCQLGQDRTFAFESSPGTPYRSVHI